MKAQMISKTTISSNSAAPAGWTVMHSQTDPPVSLLRELLTSDPLQGALGSSFPPSFLSSFPWPCPACAPLLRCIFQLFSIRQGWRSCVLLFPVPPPPVPPHQLQFCLCSRRCTAASWTEHVLPWLCLVAGAVPAQLRAGLSSKALS